MKVRHEFREIFFEMGFEEMATNSFVESGFWNFDALFVPQQHPARDLQDTFYISDPKVADRPRAEDENDAKDYEKYWDNVKAVHEGGKFGSRGYRYDWAADESLRLVLRTHTTAVSTAMLVCLIGLSFVIWQPFTNPWCSISWPPGGDLMVGLPRLAISRLSTASPNVPFQRSYSHMPMA
jgi:hypothetical protein